MTEKTIVQNIPVKSNVKKGKFYIVDKFKDFVYLLVNGQVVIANGIKSEENKNFVEVEYQIIDGEFIIV